MGKEGKRQKGGERQKEKIVLDRDREKKEKVRESESERKSDRESERESKKKKRESKRYNIKIERFLFKTFFYD